MNKTILVIVDKNNKLLANLSHIHPTIASLIVTSEDVHRHTPEEVEAILYNKAAKMAYAIELGLPKEKPKLKVVKRPCTRCNNTGRRSNGKRCNCNN